MSWYRRLVVAQIQNFLQQRGLDEQSINNVMALPPDQQKWVSTFVAKTPGVNWQQIQQALQTNQPKAPVKTPAQELSAMWGGGVGWWEGELSEIDPTGKFSKWIVRQARKGDFRNEDMHRRVQPALARFVANQQRLQIKDINQYQTLHDLETALEPFGGGSKRGGFFQVNPLTLPGVQQIKQLQDGSVMYDISEPESLEKMGEGTKWCTRGDYEDEGAEESMAKYYIEQHGHILMLAKDNKPYLQMTPDLGQVMDVNDQPVKLPKEIADDLDFMRKCINYSPIAANSASPRVVKELQEEMGLEKWDQWTFKNNEQSLLRGVQRLLTKLPQAKAANPGDDIRAVVGYDGKVARINEEAIIFDVTARGAFFRVELRPVEIDSGGDLVPEVDMDVHVNRGGGSTVDLQTDIFHPDSRNIETLDDIWHNIQVAVKNAGPIKRNRQPYGT